LALFFSPERAKTRGPAWTTTSAVYRKSGGASTTFGRRRRYGRGDGGGAALDSVEALQPELTIFSVSVPGPGFGAGGGCTWNWVSCQPGPHDVGIKSVCGSAAFIGSYEQFVLQICTCFAHSVGERSPTRDGWVDGMQ
jgi:hypothetical protein